LLGFLLGHSAYSKLSTVTRTFCPVVGSYLVYSLAFFAAFFFGAFFFATFLGADFFFVRVLFFEVFFAEDLFVLVFFLAGRALLERDLDAVRRADALVLPAVRARVLGDAHCLLTP